MYAGLARAYNEGGVNTDSLFEANYEKDVRYVTAWGSTEPIDSTKARLKNALSHIKDFNHRIESMHVKSYGGAAYAFFILRQQYTVDGSMLDEYLPTTFVLERRGSSWKIVHVQRSTDYETMQQYVSIQQRREAKKWVVPGNNFFNKTVLGVRGIQMGLFEKRVGASGLNSFGKLKLPPGQTGTTKFPVFTHGESAVISINDWRFSIWGRVEREREWTWTEFLSLPQTKLRADFHCVTQWSRFDDEWEGRWMECRWRQTMAGQCVSWPRGGMRGRGQSGSGGLSSWHQTSPASGKRTVTATAPIHGRKSGFREDGSSMSDLDHVWLSME
jgi:hypothetical protein